MGSDPFLLMKQITAGTAPIIVDVRSKREFDMGHVPGARHVPFWRMAAHAKELSVFKNNPIVLYCGHGPRAHMAGATLRRRGFTGVLYLTGHMKAWKKMDLPLEAE